MLLTYFFFYLHSGLKSKKILQFMIKNKQTLISMIFCNHSSTHSFNIAIFSHFLGRTVHSLQRYNGSLNSMGEIMHKKWYKMQYAMHGFGYSRISEWPVCQKKMHLGLTFLYFAATTSFVSLFLQRNMYLFSPLLLL